MTPADFWEKVDRSGGPEMCWPWSGNASHDADRAGTLRGRIAVNGRFITAARYALELTTNSRLLPGLYVLHTCDNPICVNPAHLRAGTQADNQRERRAKGRNGPNHRPLDIEKVREIHRLVAKGETSRAIAAKFDVSAAMISYIRTGKAWRPIYEEFHPEAIAA